MTRPDDGPADPSGSADTPPYEMTHTGKVSEDERWLVLEGRRWRRTDPSLPDDVVAALTSHLGRARSAVRSGRRDADEDAVAAARRRVGLAKHGLGERGPRWWEEPEADRLDRARRALEELDALAPPTH